MPLLLKIAPDLDDNALAVIAETALASGIDGMIVTNTTIAREKLQRPRAGAARPAACQDDRCSTARPRCSPRLRRAVGREMVLSASAASIRPKRAVAKIRAGADLVQLYTGLVFEGPDLPARLLADVPLLAEAAASIADMVGVDADRWSETT